jgi:leucyl aminopeptidase
MKSDMAGAACMAGTIYAAALNKLPVHIIGLIPATDNRPGLNAYAPGEWHSPQARAKPYLL